MAIKPPTSRHKKRPPLVGRWLAWIYFPLLLLAGLLLLALWKSGNFLTGDDVFEHVPWAILISGEGAEAERSQQLLHWQQEGRVDSGVVSGIRLYKTHFTSEWAYSYLLEGGFPRGSLFEYRNESGTLVEEARQWVRQIRLLGWDSVLVVTSNYDARRTRYVFHKLMGRHPAVIVVGAEDPSFNPRSWWSSRESRAIWLRAWASLLGAYWDGWSLKFEEGSAESPAFLPDIWSGRPGFKVAPNSVTSPLPSPELPPQVQNPVDSLSRTVDSLRILSDSLSKATAVKNLDSAAKVPVVENKVGDSAIPKVVKAEAAKPIEPGKSPSNEVTDTKGNTKVKETEAKAEAKAEARKTETKNESSAKTVTRDRKNKPTDKKTSKVNPKKKNNLDR